VKEEKFQQKIIGLKKENMENLKCFNLINFFYFNNFSEILILWFILIFLENQYFTNFSGKFKFFADFEQVDVNLLFLFCL